MRTVELDGDAIDAGRLMYDVMSAIDRLEELPVEALKDCADDLASAAGSLNSLHKAALMAWRRKHEIGMAS